MPTRMGVYRGASSVYTLRRIQRLFLGWSDYDDSEGYENFGGWDPQGPYPSSTCPCV